MHISDLRVESFRNLLTQELAFDSNINLITGSNGSGKTSLLEAIYYLGRCRSFREQQAKHLIQYDQNYFRLVAKTSLPNHQIGVERSHDNIKIRLDRETQKNNANLANLLPNIAICSHSFSLLDASPSFRRQFMDYGSFQLNAGFFRLFQTYQKALKNRNIAIKKRLSVDVINSFTPILVNSGEKLHFNRASYIEKLKACLPEHLDALSFPYEIIIRYQSGWREGESLEEVLLRHFKMDCQLGYTRYGPHRSDIIFQTTKAKVANTLSRGQQKTLLLALYLAQLDIIYQDSLKKPILIIDDIAAEFDEQRRNHIMQYLLGFDCQMFFSTTEASLFSKLTHSKTRQLHLESGKITYTN